jgi:hypothetical protein
VIGERESPQGVVVSLHGDQPLSMELWLDPYGRASSWASLLRAYEEWTFADGDQIRQDFCKKLMTTLPNGLTGNFQRPSPLYLWFVNELQPSQAELLRSMIKAEPSPNGSWIRQLHDFWTGTVPRADRMRFQGVQSIYRSSLHEMRVDTTFGPDDEDLDDGGADGGSWRRGL